MTDKDFKRPILVECGAPNTFNAAPSGRTVTRTAVRDFEVHLDGQVFPSVILAVKYLRQNLDLGVAEARKFVMDLPEEKP